MEQSDGSDDEKGFTVSGPKNKEFDDLPKYLSRKPIAPAHGFRRVRERHCQPGITRRANADKTSTAGRGRKAHEGVVMDADEISSARSLANSAKTEYRNILG